MTTETTETGNEVEAPINFSLTEEGEQAMKYSRSCKGCDKFNVCFIWRELVRILQNNTGVTPAQDKEQKLPIKIENLAIICHEYKAKENAPTD